MFIRFIVEKFSLYLSGIKDGVDNQLFFLVYPEKMVFLKKGGVGLW